MYKIQYETMYSKTKPTKWNNISNLNAIKNVAKKLILFRSWLYIMRSIIKTGSLMQMSVVIVSYERKYKEPL